MLMIRRWWGYISSELEQLMGIRSRVETCFEGIRTKMSSGG
jgi:hypothetical protein